MSYAEAESALEGLWAELGRIRSGDRWGLLRLERRAVRLRRRLVAHLGPRHYDLVMLEKRISANELLRRIEELLA